MLRIMTSIKKRYQHSLYDGDDLAQEAYNLAITICEKYNPETGPLYNFLSIAVNNRVKNFIRNASNKEIKTISISNIEEETIKIGNMKTSYEEFWSIIDEQLSAEYRPDYLRLRQGIKLPKIRKMKLINELKRIVNECL